MELSFIAVAGQPLEVAALTGDGDRLNASYRPGPSGSTVIADFHNAVCQHVGLDLPSDHTMWCNSVVLSSSPISEGL
jgi:hypothetical protein